MINLIMIILSCVVIIAWCLLLGYASVGASYKGDGGTHIYPKPPIAPKPNYQVTRDTGDIPRPSYVKQRGKPAGKSNPETTPRLRKKE